MSGWRIGVDGGGSGTRCWVADAAGTVCGTATAGPSNPGAVPSTAAWRRVETAVREALRQAGAEPGAAAGGCLALAGWDRAPLREQLARHAEALGLGGPVRCVPDAAAAWAGALHGRPGVAVVAGTGSIAYGRNAAAAEARAGGWGPLFGDEGGGADLGRRAVAAALRATDGRGPETDLGRLLCRALDLREPAEALGRLPWRAASPSALAALAPLVLKACAAGDAVAAALVGEAAAALGDLAAALFRRLGLAPETARVAGCGGLLAGGGPLREALDRDLRARGVAAGLLFPELPGVGGAVLLAHGAAGGDAAAWRLRAPAGGG